MRIWRAFIQEAREAGAGALQRLTLRGLRGEIRSEGVERLQPYGLATQPLADFEALAISLDGSQVVVVAVDCSAARPQDLQAGDVCIWRKDSDARITLKADGRIYLGDGNDPLVRKSDLDSVKSQFDTHAHSAGGLTDPSSGSPVTGVSGGPTASLNVPACSDLLRGT